MPVSPLEPHDAALEAELTEAGIAAPDGRPSLRSYTPKPSERAANYLADYIGQDYANKAVLPLSLLADPIYEGGQNLAKSYLGGTLFEDAPMAMLEAGIIPVPGVAPAARAAKGIRAYHGSPHDFDKFSMDKIGTGEGAQAYGHGLYFAESKGVAKSYRDDLSELLLQRKKGDGRPIDFPTFHEDLRGVPGPLDDEWKRSISSLLFDAVLKGGDTKRIRRIFTQNPHFARGGNARKHLDQMIRQARQYKPVTSGRMYEVNIKADPDEFLDYDALFKDQTPSVQRKLVESGIHKPSPSGEPVIKEVDGKYQIFIGDEAVSAPYGRKIDAEKRIAAGVRTEDATYNPTTGRAVYEGALDSPQDPISSAKLSSRLRDAGIPGIKYLDQGSRRGGQGTRNFVVFSDDIIDIVKKYGIAGASTMLGLSQADIAEAMPRDDKLQADLEAITAP